MCQAVSCISQAVPWILDLEACGRYVGQLCLLVVWSTMGLGKRLADVCFNYHTSSSLQHRLGNWCFKALATTALISCKALWSGFVKACYCQFKLSSFTLCWNDIRTVGWAHMVSDKVWPCLSKAFQKTHNTAKRHWDLTTSVSLWLCCLASSTATACFSFIALLSSSACCSMALRLCVPQAVALRLT